MKSGSCSINHPIVCFVQLLLGPSYFLEDKDKEQPRPLPRITRNKFYSTPWLQFANRNILIGSNQCFLLGIYFLLPFHHLFLLVHCLHRSTFVPVLRQFYPSLLVQIYISYFVQFFAEKHNRQSGPKCRQKFS